ncbi:unnamed protein product, partial [Meganyctiphanes norvegica]
AGDNSLLEQSWNDLNSTLLEQLKALNSTETPHMKRKADVIHTSNIQQHFDAFDDHNSFDNSHDSGNELETSQVQEISVVRGFENSGEGCINGSGVQHQTFDDHNGFKNSLVTINEFETSQVQETSVVRGFETSREGCTNGSRIEQLTKSGEVKGMTSSVEVRGMRHSSFVSRLPIPRPTKGRLKRRPSYVLPPVYKAAADPTAPPTVVRCFVSRLPQPQPVKYSTP